MDDKKMEGQKTVVAFVAGLLIGGLLVWVFTASGNDNPPEERASNTEDEMMNDEEMETPRTNTEAAPSTSSVTPSRAPETRIDGDFVITVANQSAGNTVVLGEVEYPTAEGWIVVHEDANGMLGNALGAARYNTEVGLLPTQVDLLRGTTSGMTYHVVYYSEDGDRVFELRADSVMIGEDGKPLSTTFTAQ